MCFDKNLVHPSPLLFFSVHSAVFEDGAEIFLSPAVTYGPPGLDLSCPIAMTVAHCAEVSAGNWTIRLKRQIQDNKWEVSGFLLLLLLLLTFPSSRVYQRDLMNDLL